MGFIIDLSEYVLYEGIYLAIFVVANKDLNHLIIYHNAQTKEYKNKRKSSNKEFFDCIKHFQQLYRIMDQF